MNFILKKRFKVYKVQCESNHLYNSLQFNRFVTDLYQSVQASKLHICFVKSKAQHFIFVHVYLFNGLALLL